MTHSSPTPLALTDQNADGDTSQHPSRHDGWTTQRQVTFLRALAATHSVAEAAREAGMSRQTAYALRARLKGEPFDHAWHAALRCRFDALAEAALERALHGVEVPHFHRGELIHTSRKFDERLTVALLAMRNQQHPPGAEYQEKLYRDQRIDNEEGIRDPRKHLRTRQGNEQSVPA